MIRALNLVSGDRVEHYLGGCGFSDGHRQAIMKIGEIESLATVSISTINGIPRT